MSFTAHDDPLLSSRHVRLFTIDPTETLSGRLSTTSLDETPEYDALSYAWGANGETFDFECSGKLMKVHRNLFNALNTLKKKPDRRPIWIDAVCINQADDHDKSVSIPLMREIYGNAKRVVIWLGEATEHEFSLFADLPRIVECLEKAEKRIDIEDNDTWLAKHDLPHTYHDTWNALGKLLARPYFRRLWVFQEIILAKDIEVRCGPLSVPFQVLEHFKKALDQHSLQEILSIRVHEPEEAIAINGAFEHLGRIITTRLNFFQNGVSIPWLLMVARGRQVTVTSDRVFGILGLVDDQVRSDMGTVDVSLPTKEVFTRFALSFAPRDYNLSLLTFHDVYNEDTDMPSWFPDLTQDQKVMVLFGAVASVYGFHAGFRPPRQNKQVLIPVQPPHSNLICIFGIGADMVSEKVEWPREYRPWQPNNDRPWLQSPESATASLEWEVACHTLFKGTDVGKLPNADEIYVRALIADVLSKSTQLEITTAHLEEWRAACIKCISGGEFTLSHGASTFMGALQAACVGRAFISTVAGRVGYAPFNVEVKDVLCVFENAFTPYALRFSGMAIGARKPNGEEVCNDKLWRLVGEAYVYNLMHGEGLDMQDKGLLERKRWIIC